MAAADGISGAATPEGHPWDESFFTAAELRSFMNAQAQARAEAERRSKEKAEAAHRAYIESLKKPVQITEAHVHRAEAMIRAAAAEGHRELMIFRFPHELCDDLGVAINNFEPDWPATLTGAAKSVYDAWSQHIRPLGYGLKAQVLDYPDGMLGDIGLFLTW